MGQKLRGVNHQRKPRGGQVSGERPHALNGLIKNRLRVYQLQDASDRHQLNAQGPLKPKIPQWSSEEPVCSWSREQQASPQTQTPASMRSLGCSEHLATFWRGLREEK